jgi:hypothetical protein
MVEDFVGRANSGVGLAVINGVAVIASIFVQPTVGVISDYTITRWGRRKPYIFIGGLLDMVFLYGIAPGHVHRPRGLFSDPVHRPRPGPFLGCPTGSGSPGRHGQRADGPDDRAADRQRESRCSLQEGSMLSPPWPWVRWRLACSSWSSGSTRDDGTERPCPAAVALSAWGTDILREERPVVAPVRLLFPGAAAAATSLGLYYFQRTHGLLRDEAVRSSSSRP